MTSIVFAPLVPAWLALPLAAVAILLLGFALWRRAPGALLRAAALGLLALAILDPRLAEETRETRPDVAVIALDRSASQSVDGRGERTDAALADLRAALGRLGNVEVREIEVKDDEGGRGAEAEGTRLYTALERALAQAPRGRIGAAFALTDGQVHDAPDAAAAKNAAAVVAGPVHVLLTGRTAERDRRVVIERAPGFAIVGKETSLGYRIDDPETGVSSVTGRRLARVKIVRDGTPVEDSLVPVDAPQTHAFIVEHAGPTLIEIEAEAVPGELTLANNRALVTVNGVRERLKVLLVSGQPHPGERTWRNLLKSDPAVELIHFTILRPPEKDDFTPIVELALIPFPVQELFEVKLKEFDLIVFDRYLERDIIPPSHFRNMERYVRDGGALLLSAGPEFAGARSLGRTAIGSVLPAQPTGRVTEGAFRPLLTDTGRRHPVTADLTPVVPPVGAGASATPGGLARAEGTPTWGRWFRLIETTPRSGHAIVEAGPGRSLLMVDRVDKGRVALFASDHIWLWARGFDQGGPHAEILRRLVHWLMKEPDLEEERLTAEAKGAEIVVTRRSLADAPVSVTVTAPSGRVTTVEMKPDPATPGRASARVPTDERGLHRLGDGRLAAFAVVGALHSLEFADLRANADRLAPLARATGGGVFWLANGIPEVRGVRAGRDAAGRGWMGLRRNEAFAVTGIRQIPLLPPLLMLAAVFAALALAWWREGR
ncbi:MAG: hypothetical protein EXR02_01710 [Rhodospirillales bacterium]|nr:hypothetical protein [Rhodospirillales bacterium]MSP79770.1 hypothetical protein [Rhodospirillales bacterium]